MMKGLASFKELVAKYVGEEDTEDKWKAFSHIRPGTYVKIHSLKEAKAYNGVVGVVTAWDNGRFNVLLQNGEMPLIRPENLSVLPPDEQRDWSQKELEHIPPTPARHSTNPTSHTVTDVIAVLSLGQGQSSAPEVSTPRPLSPEREEEAQLLQQEVVRLRAENARLREQNEPRGGPEGAEGLQEEGSMETDSTVVGGGERERLLRALVKECKRLKREFGEGHREWERERTRLTAIAAEEERRRQEHEAQLQRVVDELGSVHDRLRLSTQDQQALREETDAEISRLSETITDLQQTISAVANCFPEDGLEGPSLVNAVRQAVTARDALIESLEASEQRSASLEHEREALQETLHQSIQQIEQLGKADSRGAVEVVGDVLYNLKHSGDVVHSHVRKRLTNLTLDIRKRSPAGIGRGLLEGGSEGGTEYPSRVPEDPGTRDQEEGAAEESGQAKLLADTDTPFQ